MRIEAFRRGFALLLGLVIVCGSAGFYVFRQRQIHDRFIKIRQDGLDAIQVGDKPRGAELLRTYLQRYPDDIDALASFARVRPLVPSADNSHLAETIATLRHLLSLQPARVEERRALLSLYVKTGFLMEAEDTSSILLNESAEDAETLRLTTTAEIGLQKMPQALAAVDRWISRSPDDLNPKLIRLWILRKGNVSQQEIISDRLLKAPATDARNQLLLGFAYAICDDRAKAAEHLRSAASAIPKKPDPMFIKLLREQLDAVQLFDESLSTLERAYAVENDPEQRDQLILRYWEAGRIADVSKLMDGAKADAPKMQDDLLGIYALSLHEQKRDGEIPRVQGILLSRKNDPVAVAWNSVVEQSLGAGSPDPEHLLGACKAALQVSPGGDPYLSYFVGDAYARMNKFDLAVAAWRNAAQQSRAWSLPLIRLADAFCDSGRYESALQAAAEGVRRTSHNLRAGATWARVWAVCMNIGRYDEPGKLLDLVTQIQREFPNESQTLSIQVALLARMGKLDEARKVLAGALAGTTPFDEQVILNLAAVSQQYKLALEQNCFDRAQKEHGMTSSLAYARAIHEFVEGRNGEGLKIFELCRSQAQHKDSVEWRLAWARYLDAIQDPRAPAVIGALADDQPGDVYIQRLVLSARSTRTDKAAMDRAVQRLQKVVGERGSLYQLARARWLLQFATDRAEIETAITLLNDVIRVSPDLADARVLLARGYERIRRFSDAVDQITIAEKLNPNSTSIGLYLARLLQSRGDLEPAREQLERVVDRQLPDATERHQAAVLFAEQGEPERAIELLEEANRQSTEQGSEDLLLAELYRQRSQPDKAEAICRKLLEKPNASVIQFSSNLLAAQGRKDEAVRILSKLDDLKLEPGVKELILADYTARHVSVNASIKLYRAAIQAAKKQPAVWRSLIFAYVASGDVDQALAVDQDALKELPGDTDLQAIAREGALLKTTVPNPALRQLAISFIREPADDTAAQALRLILSAMKNGQPLRELLPSLAQLGSQHPRLFALHMYLCSAYAQVGQFEEAISEANHAIDAVPTSPEAIGLLTGVLQAAERWNESLDAAKRWRDRTPNDPIAADVAIARAQIALKQAPAAMELLKNYMRDPTLPGYDAVRETYARAEVATAGSNSAAVMKPVLAEGARGRHAWIAFATRNLQNAEAGLWLEQVTPLVPPDAEEEWIFLSEAWGDLAGRSGDKQYAKNARQCLASFLTRGEPSAGVMLAMGVREEQDGNYAAAESWYRHVLAGNRVKEGQVIAAQNNLAIVLSKRSANLKEAADIATSLVQAHPETAPFYDTLAAVQSRAREYSKAVANMDAAVHLQPRKPIYRLNLAYLLNDSGRRDDAKRALQDFDDLKPNLAQMKLADRSRLASLRVDLTKAVRSRR